MKKFLLYVLDRIRERSTWLGIISVLTAIGVVLTPEQKEAIAASGVAMAGLVAAFTKDLPK